MIYGSATGLSSAANQLWAQNSAGIADGPDVGDAFAAALAAGDLDGDGDGDLIAGVPGESAGTNANAGLVHAIYGSGAGLSSAGSQSWNQNSSGIADKIEAGDRFGAALAAGDMNGDSRDDLGVGVPSEGIGTIAGAGALNLIYGSAGGLTATGNQLWQQDSAGITESAEAGDSFGAALAAADLNGDSRADLAIGVPAETSGAILGGGLNVIYGSATGLGATGNQLWSSGQPQHPRSGGGGRPVRRRARGGRWLSSAWRPDPKPVESGPACGVRGHRWFGWREWACTRWRPASARSGSERRRRAPRTRSTT